MNITEMASKEVVIWLQFNPEKNFFWKPTIRRYLSYLENLLINMFVVY